MSYNHDASDTNPHYTLQYDGHPEAKMAQDEEIAYNNKQPNYRAELAKQLLVS